MDRKLKKLLELYEQDPDIIKRVLPSGAGFDNPDSYIVEKDDNTLIITGQYHKMNDVGYYVGWHHFKLLVFDSPIHGMDIKYLSEPEDFIEFHDTDYVLDEIYSALDDLIGSYSCENIIIRTDEIACLSSETVHDDVLERLDQLWSFESLMEDKNIYSVERIEFTIIENDEDDTNETTRIRIEKLITKLKQKGYKYFAFC